MFNASRQVVAAARTCYAGVAVVMLDAPVEVRAARLATRNRERAEQVLARLGRVVPGFSAADVDLAIDNSGALEAAADQLVHWLRMLAAAWHPKRRRVVAPLSRVRPDSPPLVGLGVGGLPASTLCDPPLVPPP